MNKITIIVLFSILFITCKKEDATLFNKNQNLDSLILSAQKSHDNNYKLKTANKVVKYIQNDTLDSISRKRYISIAKIYLSVNNSKYVKICNLLILKPSKLNDNKESSFCHFALANYYYDIANYEKSFFHYSKAEKSFIVLKYNVELGYSLNTRANILSLKKDFIGAEKLSIEALKIARQEKYNLLIYNCYITLGNSLSGLHNYKKALEYYNKALAETANLKLDSNYLSCKLQPYNYIASVYRELKQYNDAIHYAQKGLSLIPTKNNQILIYCYLTNNLAYSKFKLDDKSALHQFQETLKIGNNVKSNPIQITSKKYLGEYYLKEKDTLKANFYLKDVLVQAHQNKLFEDELKILNLLAHTNPGENDFYNNRFIALDDSLQDVERATRDKYTRIEFETDEITTQKNVVANKNLQLLNSIWVILSIGFLAILLIYVIYKNLLQKAKTRELLLKQEQQNANEAIYQLMIDQQQQIEEGKNTEKQRISQELHDGVMGKLSAVRLNLYAALYKANLIEDPLFAKQIDEIQAVEQEIRTIAHDLNSNLFSDNANFTGIVKELFYKIENHSQIHFTLEVSDALKWDLIHNTTKINLYRILQEALQNIEKHANANNVAVVMALIETKEINILISDDGKGFDTNQKKNGIGIKNMKARIMDLNGTFVIHAKVGKGTKINLIIPI